MNRDEKLTRVRALPPARQELQGHAALFPSEPGGGTWIGTNDAGVSFALINWYSVPAQVSGHAISRGLVVRSALACQVEAKVDDGLRAVSLDRTNPFRLLGFFPKEKHVIEWRWNLSRLERVEHGWETNIWISSGFDEPGAERSRRKTFQSSLRNQPVQNLNWLRSLHASHAPTPGPYSVCMHRRDAATVSYTEIAVSDAVAHMTYWDGSPCCGHRRDPMALGLPLRRQLAEESADTKLGKVTRLAESPRLNPA